MTSRYEAYVDGVALSSVDPSIYVLNIQTGEKRKNIRTNKIAGRMGARVTKKTDENTSVNVLFEIHEYDIVKRQAICQKVRKWADGYKLVVSDRPDQFLNCVCETYPVANAKEWTEMLTIGFVAYNPPYWQERDATEIEVTNTTEEDDSKFVYIPGNAPVALVSCIANVEENVTEIIFATDTSYISLYGIEAIDGDVIEVGYDDNNIMYIKINGDSIIDKRTGDSSDDLIAVCGKMNNFTISANGDVTTTYSVRGCWY